MTSVDKSYNKFLNMLGILEWLSWIYTGQLFYMYLFSYVIIYIEENM